MHGLSMLRLSDVGYICVCIVNACPFLLMESSSCTFPATLMPAKCIDGPAL